MMRIVWNTLCVWLVLAPFVALAAETVSKSTADEQVGMEVTVYNNNLGLVKDTRRISLPKGRGELQFMDVASSIMPVTVQAKSVNKPDAFTILEQNYEYDLIDKKKLLDKYVGKQVKLVNVNQFKDRTSVVDAVLLSNNQGPVYMIDGEIHLEYQGYPVLPKLPADLIAKPTLTWLYDNAADKPLDLEVSYLTNNLNWKADYVVLVNADDSKADVSGWVTLDNKSGASYKDARLKLVAGDVHRVTNDRRVREVQPYAGSSSMKVPEQQFVEKTFFEYHIYDLQRKTTVKNNQTKQVSLLEAYGAGIKKELLVYGIKTYHTRQFTERQTKQPVNVYITFKNSKDNKLGMPLPAGIMRLYKQDTDGSRQFIGEDRSLHIAKDEEVRLKVGEAFDVVAERKQIDFKQLTTLMHETEWEVTIRNHKDQDVSVGVIEPLPRTWEVIAKTHPFKKLDTSTIRFDVTVPKDKEIKVTYRIRVGI
jgi:hypothetical protein